MGTAVRSHPIEHRGLDFELFYSFRVTISDLRILGRKQLGLAESELTPCYIRSKRKGLGPQILDGLYFEWN